MSWSSMPGRGHVSRVNRRLSEQAQRGATCRAAGEGSFDLRLHRGGHRLSPSDCFGWVRVRQHAGLFCRVARHIPIPMLGGVRVGVRLARPKGRMRPAGAFGPKGVHGAGCDESVAVVSQSGLTTSHHLTSKMLTFQGVSSFEHFLGQAICCGHNQVTSSNLAPATKIR